MKIVINELLFVKMIESVKHCVSKYNNRPETMFIKLKISKNKVTAYACDCYCAARTTIQLPLEVETDFECYIKPIKVKPSKSGVNPVVVEYVNNVATVEVITEYGKVKYCFEQYKGDFFDLDKIYRAASCDRKIAIDPNYVKQALTAVSQIKQKGKKGVFLETQEKRTGAVVIWAKDDNCISEQLILPMTYSEAQAGKELKGGAEE